MKKSPTKKAATPKVKKRKIQEDETGDDDEAIKLLKEEMGNGADGEDDENGDEVEAEEQG